MVETDIEIIRKIESYNYEIKEIEKKIKQRNFFLKLDGFCYFLLSGFIVIKLSNLDFFFCRT